MVVGVTINASIIGNVANIVSNLETDSSDFARKVDEIKSYMFKHKLSNDLHSRVDEFTRYLWSAHCGSTNEDDFILRLPYTLQTAVIEHTRTKHIRDCQFFDFCSPDIVKALSLCLKPLVFCAGDIVCHYGDMGQGKLRSQLQRTFQLISLFSHSDGISLEYTTCNIQFLSEMFFLEHGKVDVLSADRSTCLAKLHEGSFFGETSVSERRIFNNSFTHSNKIE